MAALYTWDDELRRARADRKVAALLNERSELDTLELRHLRAAARDAWTLVDLMPQTRTRTRCAGAPPREVRANGPTRGKGNTAITVRSGGATYAGHRTLTYASTASAGTARVELLKRANNTRLALLVFAHTGWLCRATSTRQICLPS
jgi:hypothetical protein